MRILTWNVNVLRTCLDYHPFSSMKKRNIEGLLDEMNAQIICFQEHKTRRAQLEKSMACPGPYDGFWTFNRKSTGYSGVCTFVDSRYCVPLKAEEGITGLLLDDQKGTMRPPWAKEEKIGRYADIDEMEMMDEVDGRTFDPKTLDMEGRAVVCDFGLFVLFNLYSPNETNDARRPYKMNFLKVLQERVRLLMQGGRDVIVLGDINIMRAPIDSGEGGIRTSAEAHYAHPARRILDDWCAPKGPMIDVVRESWPTRDDMFTCWNQKLDARSANYGSRIDLILCTPGLRPWLNGGDILNKVFGSDHCPVYIDLHETIEHPERGTLHLKDMLNPPDRPPTMAQVYPTDPPRTAPEPPRFATKFYDEFSGRQMTIKSFFAGGGNRDSRQKSVSISQASASPTQTPVEEKDEPKMSDAGRKEAARADEALSAPFSVARAAFDSLSRPATANDDTSVGPAMAARRTSSSHVIDLTDEDPSRSKAANGKKDTSHKTKTKANSRSSAAGPVQPGIAAFFTPPASRAKRKSTTPPPEPKRQRSISSSIPPGPGTPSEVTSDVNVDFSHENALIAQAIAEADEEQEKARQAKKAEALPVWANMFAKKLPPTCRVHGKPCKDYIVKIPGPNKGKRFWLCSLPVGAGYDAGRSKRLREDVNPEFRCDFFLWDSANSRKEIPSIVSKNSGSSQAPSS